MQVPTAAPKPLMNVQYEVQKGLQENDRSSVSIGNTNKQLAAGLTQRQTTPQQVAAEQISKGQLDIKI
jgi:hypothetical protein